MNKIWLILSREYLVRVRKKSFIIMTFIGPILFGGITIVPIWLSKEAIQADGFAAVMFLIKNGEDVGFQNQWFPILIEVSKKGV